VIWGHRVRRVGVGGNDNFNNSLNANDACNNGRARGVRKLLKVSQPG